MIAIEKGKAVACAGLFQHGQESDNRFPNEQYRLTDRKKPQAPKLSLSLPENKKPGQWPGFPQSR